MFEMPSARCVQAAAFEKMGNVRKAIEALKHALDWELQHPNFLTTASIDYPMIVVRHRVVDEYESALETLLERFKPADFSFAATRYRWNGCQALIRFEISEFAEARHFAERALVAASATESAFRYHRTVGLVDTTSDDFGRRIKAVARPSVVRSLFKLFKFR